MKDWEDLELSLLFKELVILKEDSQTTGDPTEDISAENSVDQPDLTTRANLDTPPLEKAPPKPDCLKTAILCPASALSVLNSSQSNLRKITEALRITSIHTQLRAVEDLDIESKIGPETTIWGIGLSSEQKEAIRSQPHSKVLFSANPEELSSLEEKRQMFEPLKEFSSYLK